MDRNFRLKNNAWFTFSKLDRKPYFMSLDDILKNLDSLSSYAEVWFDDDIEYDKTINLIISNDLSNEQIKSLLDIYGIHDNYVKLYPALKHIIMTTDDEGLFCKAGDIISLIEVIVHNNQRLQKWLHKEIYQMFWSRIHSIENIVNLANQPIIEYSMSQILNLPLVKHYNPSLCKYLRRLSMSQEETPNMPISVAFYILDMTHEPLKDKFEYMLGAFPIAYTLYFNDRINTTEDAEVYLDLILDRNSLFFRTPRVVMDTLRQLLNRRRPAEVELYILQRLVNEFEIVCEKAEINDHDRAVVLMEAACRTATQHSEPLKELGRKCWSLNQDNNADSYKAVDNLLQMASRNIDHIMKQRILLTNIPRYTRKVEKTTN